MSQSAVCNTCSFIRGRFITVSNKGFLAFDESYQTSCEYAAGYKSQMNERTRLRGFQNGANPRQVGKRMILIFTRPNSNIYKQKHLFLYIIKSYEFELIYYSSFLLQKLGVRAP